MGVEGSVIFEHFEGLNMYLFIIILWNHQVCVTSVLLKLSHWPKTLNFFLSTLACLYKIMRHVLVCPSSFLSLDFFFHFIFH